MKAARRLLCLLLCLMLLGALGAPAVAAEPTPFAVTVSVSGRESAQVRAFWESYEGNLYLSLTDLSLALEGTEKQFKLVWSSGGNEGEVFTLKMGQRPATGTGNGAPEPTQTPVPEALWTTRHRLFVDESERRYYSYRPGWRDLFLSLTDVQLCLDMTAEILDEGHVALWPERPFTPEPEALLAAGWFEAVGAYLVADADTDKVLYSYNPRLALPVASLSKLMSYLVLSEGIEAGELSLDGKLAVSARAEALSKTPDGLIDVHAGQQVSVAELMSAMLVASSNEAALVLAEGLCGSEEAFVARMNQRAEELGLRSAVFRSAHGLPVYTGSVPAKRQNEMSAQDLFVLCRLLLDDYPHITGLSGQRYVKLEELAYNTANSNPLVFNMPGVNGLKTGSTNRAGYCLAASLPVTVGNETHTLVLVLLGAETAQLRGQAAELLLRAAKRQCEAQGF